MERTGNGGFAQLFVSCTRDVRLPRLNISLALFTLYFGAAFAAIGLAGQAANLAFFWPAGPILFVFLLRSHPSHWLPLLAIAALADVTCSLTLGGNLKSASLVALFAVGEALAIAVSTQL